MNMHWKKTMAMLPKKLANEISKIEFWVMGYVLVFAVASRFWPHLWNATAIGALALLAGAKIRNYWLALTLPFISLLISDFALGFHETMPFVYGAMALTVWLGRRKGEGLIWLGGASLASSCAFFLITNLGVWLVGGLYPRTLAGLATCFTMAIPFFRGQWAGDLVFTALAFAGWSLVMRLRASHSSSSSLKA